MCITHGKLSLLLNGLHGVTINMSTIVCLDFFEFLMNELKNDNSNELEKGFLNW